MVICLERGADLHMAQLMLVPLTVSCCSKIQTGFTFLVLAHPGSPGNRAVKWGCMCVFLRYYCFDTVGWAYGGASGLLGLSDVMLVWLSVWKKMQTMSIWAS